MSETFTPVYGFTDKRRLVIESKCEKSKHVPGNEVNVEENVCMKKTL